MMQIFYRLKKTLMVFATVLASVPLYSQETLSTLRGTATDPSGALVPGVAITVQETLTNAELRKVTTDSQGNYEIPGLKQGTYRLTAAMAGFKVFAANEIIHSSNQIRRYRRASGGRSRGIGSDRHGVGIGDRHRAGKSRGGLQWR